ncbi:MAG TPA: hypothetical protein VN213_13655 [Solirubrobacteraceae bacterium]|nr:hypothetical protein [Solirubrobacteraceae bacterium]
MASAYPGALDSLATNKADATAAPTDHPAHHNDLADAVNKIETELGTNPSGSAADVKTRLDATLTVRKSADQTFANQTLANVNDLSFAIGANLDYAFDFTVMYSAGSARGIRFACTISGTNTRISYAVEIFGIGADGTDSTTQGTGTSSGDAVASAAAQTGSHIARIRGIVSQGNGAGTLQVQSAQGSGGTSSTATVMKGSFGVLWAP